MNPLDPPEGWQQRTKDELDHAATRAPSTTPIYENRFEDKPIGATMEELLGKHVCDAILDVVAE